MSETVREANDHTSEQTVHPRPEVNTSNLVPALPASGDQAELKKQDNGPGPEPADFDDREFAPCVPPPAPYVHLCKLVNLPDLWWELFYEHPGFMCEFCEGLENMEYSPDEEEIVGVFCESCRIKIARLPANACPGSAPGCLAVRWVGPLGEISDFCRTCAQDNAAYRGRAPPPKKHSDEAKPRRRGKRGGRRVRARKERQQRASGAGLGADTEGEEIEAVVGVPLSSAVEPGHASRPYGLEIQLGKTPGLRVVESVPALRLR